MTTLSYNTDAQRPSGAIPSSLQAVTRERVDHIDGLAEAAAAAGDSRSITYVQLAEEARNAKGDVDA